LVSIVNIAMNKLTIFFKEARSELMKVNWPTKQQTINYTLAVIGISIAVALFLGGLDWFFEYLLKTFILK
jgi:preprotein translocase subunit SecE